MTNTATSSPALSIDLNRCARWVAMTSMIVVALGVVREIVILQIGYDTPLKEIRHIALDSELSLPAFYSALLILSIGLGLLVISRAVRQTQGPDAGRWAILGVIFCLMALDEAASFHESLMMPLRNAFDLTGILYYSWVIPGALGVGVIGAYFLPFVLRLPRRTAVLFVAAGAAYVGGALGMELVGGALEESIGKQTAAYSVSIVVEEGLEIVGLSLFFYALTDYVGRTWKTIYLQFASSAARARASVIDPVALPAE